MQGSRIAVILGLVVCLSAAVATGPQPKPKPKAAKVSYGSVAPIIKANCVACHMGAHPKHGLNLMTYANVMKGDTEGKVVVPGKPANSRLSKAVHRSGAAPMPPAGPLKPADVAKIDAWIKAGAKP